MSLLRFHVNEACSHSRVSIKLLFVWLLLGPVLRALVAVCTVLHVTVVMKRNINNNKEL